MSPTEVAKYFARAFSRANQGSGTASMSTILLGPNNSESLAPWHVVSYRVALCPSVPALLVSNPAPRAAASRLVLATG
jgi:hypothetical protein